MSQEDESPTVVMKRPPKPHEFDRTLTKAMVRVQDEPERNSPLPEHRAIRVYINNRSIEGWRHESDRTASLFVGTVSLACGEEDVPSGLLSRDLRVLRISNGGQRTRVVVSLISLTALALSLNDK